MDKAVEKAIECMWERYNEPLSLAEMASCAGLSRFHFARRFRDETGTTPGRFLAAVRIHRAGLLLRDTAMSVTEVASAVGYGSPGSFTSCFTAGVGLPPGRFRRLPRTGGFEPPGARPAGRTGTGAVAGTIGLPEGRGNARVFLGAFPTPVLRHPPVAWMVVDVPSGRPACYRLADVPEGTWYLHAVGEADGVGPDPSSRRHSLVARNDAVPVSEDAVTSAAVRLHRPRPVDPPVLLALPDLEPPPALTGGGCPVIGSHPKAAV
ncbi:AraC family transcriptional regulator [Actinomadura sp. GC306]|uniref:helix-turn-helix domain-containing protein n=1 Tax=Actinomadura sp. GC306 TaxID=2530367 RepID=UPI00104BF6DD|nr:AraC family transcriptional regulator [Actinomadura sp. GC306]TDC72042.1 AraC family transcriptional regulator [Actinomadura sp. GC306]